MEPKRKVILGTDHPLADIHDFWAELVIVASGHMPDELIITSDWFPRVGGPFRFVQGTVANAHCEQLRVCVGPHAGLVST